MHLRYRLLVAAVGAAIPLAVQSPVQAATTAFGSVSDGSGDHQAGSGDLVGLSLTVDSAGTALVSVRFAPGTYTADTSSHVGFDVDQDPATGSAGVNSSHADAALIGTEYALYVFGTQFQGYAQLIPYYGGAWHWSGAITYPATYLPNGCDVAIPLSDLGNDDGLINFHGTTTRQYSSGSSSGIRDYIPNLGVPKGSTVPVPEPGTVLLLSLGGLALAARKLHQGICLLT